MVLRYSWHACERVRARSGRKTRVSASASVWNQLQAAHSPQSSTRPMAPPGALGGAWCSGARGSRVSVCGALRDSSQCICEGLEPAKIATDSAIEHPGDGATGGARGPQVLRCSCTLASVLLATGVELSMRMCEHLELILVLPPRRQDCLLAPAANSRSLNSY